MVSPSDKNRNPSLGGHGPFNHDILSGEGLPYGKPQLDDKARKQALSLKLRASEVFKPLSPESSFAKRHHQTLLDYRDRAVGCVIGGAATGKGTCSSQLADELDVGCIDSGAIFRTLAVVAERHGYFAGKDGVILNGSRDVGADMSRIDDKLLSLASNVPIIFHEEQKATVPSIWLASDEGKPTEDVTSTIRTKVNSELLAGLARNPFIQKALFNFIREITPDRAIVEGRDNIPNRVFLQNKFKSVVMLVVDPKTAAARRLAQERGEGEKWRELMNDPAESENIEKVSLAIFRRNLADGVPREKVPPGVVVVNTTHKSVEGSVLTALPKMREMFSEWEEFMSTENPSRKRTGFQS